MAALEIKNDRTTSRHINITVFGNQPATVVSAVIEASLPLLAQRWVAWDDLGENVEPVSGPTFVVTVTSIKLTRQTTG